MDSVADRVVRAATNPALLVRAELESAGAYRTATQLSRVGPGAVDRLFEAVLPTGYGLRVAAIRLDLES